MVLYQLLGKPAASARDALAREIARTGAHPDALTVAGLLVYLVAGGLFAIGRFHWAVAAVCAASLFDVFDGAVARVSGRTTKFGGVLDSVLDRYSDAAVFGGVILYYLKETEPQQVIVGGIALVGALAVSYVRARAECVVESCKVGFAERPERLVFLMLGALGGHMLAALWTLAILAHWTAFVRLRHARRTLAGRPPEGLASRLLFWSFDRGSLAYDILVVAVGATCFFGLPV